MAVGSGGGTMNGCVKWTSIGCGAALMVILVVSLVVAQFIRQAIPDEEPLEAVSVEGPCDATAARAFLEGQDERLDALSEEMDRALNSTNGDGGLRASLEAVDLTALSARRQALLENVEAPDCAAGLLTAEVGLVDEIVDSIERMRACGADSSLCLTREMIATMTLLGDHYGRIAQARREVARTAGIDPAEFERGGGPQFRYESEIGR